MHDDYDFDGRESGTGTIIGVFILSAIILAGTVGLMWYLQGPFVGRKLLVALAAPIGMLWILFFLIAMTATFTKQKFLACLGWLSMVALSTIGNDSFSSGLMESLERANPRYEFKKGESFDYGFVLGGGLEFKKNGELDFNSANERIYEAVEMYRQGKIKHLVFTGSPFLWSQDKEFDNESKDNSSDDKKSKESDEAEKDKEKDENKDALPDFKDGIDLGNDDGQSARPVSFVTQEKEKKSETQEDDKKSSTEQAKSDTPTKQEEKKEKKEEVLDQGKSDPTKMDLEVSDQEPEGEKKAESDLTESDDDRKGRLSSLSDEELFVAKLVAMGVKKEDVSFLSGRTTHEEMFRIDEFLKDKPDATCALITSAWHMNRASKLGREQALQLTSIPVDFRTGPKQKNPIFFVPNTAAFHESSVAIKEIIAAWF